MWSFKIRSRIDSAVHGVNPSTFASINILLIIYDNLDWRRLTYAFTVFWQTENIRMEYKLKQCDDPFQLSTGKKSVRNEFTCVLLPWEDSPSFTIASPSAFGLGRDPS